VELTRDTRNIPVFVKSGAVLPLATVTNSTSDVESRELQIRIFGDGSLPFLCETSTGKLQITWNAISGSGSVKQEGNDRYSISSWIQAGLESQSGSAHG
jgi:alpha-glucosidase (family GH31 glycosyl hydrolase)